MRPDKSVYGQAVMLSVEYLGPAGERFIRRQITTHLDKEPEALNKQDLKKLSDWIKLAFAMLTENQKLVESFTESLRSITAHNHGSSRVNGARVK